MQKSSQSGFYQLTTSERLLWLKKNYSLTDHELDILSSVSPLPLSLSSDLIENSIGYFAMPMGVATNFVIDSVARLIPMVVVETSVIAAASSAAKWVAKYGEISTSCEGDFIIGQIQIPHVSNPAQLCSIIKTAQLDWIAHINKLFPSMVKRGGGLKVLQVRTLSRYDGNGLMCVVHALYDSCDAMGANLINQVCEALKPLIEEVTGHKVGLCILSNLVDTKMVCAEVSLKIDREEALKIVEATEFAKSDPYRAATHNKGILNGIDPLLIATGNDWRAVEAGLHSYAARNGSVQPLSDWTWSDQKGLLKGYLRVPFSCGTVGGVTQLHPVAKIALKILNITKASELARIAVAVGLVQNLAALRALTTVGIVQGHMSLHAKNLALAAGSNQYELDFVQNDLIQMLKTKKQVSLSIAKEILLRLRTV